MQNLSDKELLDLFNQKDYREQAFSLVVQKYQERLYWQIRRIVLNHDDADDVLQNTFVKIWSGLEHFREESSLFTWIYRIAVNESFSFLKKRKRGEGISLYENSQYAEPEADPYFDGNELEEKLQKAVLALPRKQQLVFNMKYFDEMKYEDMAEVLETSVGALKASYHHAVKKVEEFMKNH